MNITAGKYKGQKIIAPDENITRPTLSKVRMSVFNTLQSLIEFNNSSFLDMYAGSGIMGLEALSRGFSRVIAIERNRKVFNIIKANYKKYEQGNDIKILCADSTKICAKLTEKFDVIYIDPPYYSGIYEESLKAVSEIAKGIIILEHVTEVDYTGYEIIKQKQYGDKKITIIKKTSQLA